jgi:hypothetical protein
MSLPRRFKVYTFAVCFGISLFPFVAINLLMYTAALRWSNCDTVVAAGFPIKWYVAAWLGGGMIWDAFVLNVMLALTASVISARILRPIFQPND